MPQSPPPVPARDKPHLSGPPFDYLPAPDHFTLPAGANFGGVSGVDINSRGHIFVFHRGAGPLMEFDPDGRFVRAYGDGLFQRPHGLRIDHDDHIWLTDVGAHFAAKLDPKGRIVMVIGVKGNGGEWHRYGHLRLLDEPNEVVTAADGSFYILQGHGKAPSTILKFDRDANFLGAFGTTGRGPGEFDIPHSMVIDGDGLLHVADRSNGRLQVFDAEGRYLRETALPGTPCALHRRADGTLFLAHGHAGQVAQLTPEGRVLGVCGGPGKGPGAFGEAHAIAVSARGEIFVADPLNWRVQKFVPAG